MSIYTYYLFYLTNIKLKEYQKNVKIIINVRKESRVGVDFWQRKRNRKLTVEGF